MSDSVVPHPAELTSGLTPDHFSLFDLPRRFMLDGDLLDRKWHDLQAQAHPDRHAHQPDALRLKAVQDAVRINDAYAVLKHPLSRAQYLLELFGVDTGLNARNSMSAEFLLEQMNWRETVAEARAFSDVDALEQLAQRLRMHIDDLILLLAQQLDEAHNLEAAADFVRRLMFLDKLRREIDDALSVIDG